VKQVSTEGEELFAELVAWELLGDTEVDPKAVLRSASDEDLQTVAANVHGDKKLKDFLIVRMVELELLFREQLLGEDWTVVRNGNCVTLSFNPATVAPQPSLTVISTGVLA